MAARLLGTYRQRLEDWAKKGSIRKRLESIPCIGRKRKGKTKDVLHVCVEECRERLIALAVEKRRT
jgi:hypothetical protein